MSGGRTQTPTLINLPPPPADPMTPSDMPGTPTSTTTSMSELSTVAIKDGHRGHLHHHNNPMDAERADRISRLAGFDRVGHAGRPSSSNAGGSLTTSMAAQGQQQFPGHQQQQLLPHQQHQQQPQHPLAYFDANNAPQITRERSTVGSASATGSVGGRTTWASGSDVYDPDKMSEDASVQDDHMMELDNGSSIGDGFSDEGGAASLVGFGEGARTPARQLSSVGSPGQKAAQVAGSAQTPTSAMSGLRAVASAGGASAQTSSSAIEAQKKHARMIDGMTYDSDVVDTADRTPPPVQD